MCSVFLIVSRGAQRKKEHQVGSSGEEDIFLTVKLEKEGTESADSDSSCQEQ